MDPDDEKVAKPAFAALSFIRDCYRALFAGFLANVFFKTIIEYETISKKSFTTWVELVDVSDSLTYLIFGLGL